LIVQADAYGRLDWKTTNGSNEAFGSKWKSFDFPIAPLGSDMLLRPLTQAGRNWLSDNLPKGGMRQYSPACSRP
jgi:hypothetical protein